jgi:hypothetical protein
MLLKLGRIPESVCDTVVSDVLSLSKYWVEDRKGFWPRNVLFSLGTPLYQTDVADLKKSKHGLPREEMEEKFGHIFLGVADLVSGHLNKRAACAKDLPLPGFHIARAPRGGRVCGPLHFDLQFQKLMLLFGRQLPSLGSVTLFLDASDQHNGIEMFDFHFSEIDRQVDKSDWNTIRKRPSKTISYEKGGVYWQSGLLAHRIVASNLSGLETPRLTLQGHLVELDEEVALYW